MMEHYKSIFFNLVKSYSSLLFLNDKTVGFLLLLLTFINPSVGISGLAAVIFTILFSEFLGFEESYLLKGFYIYNSLLVGMGVGYVYFPSFTSIALIAVLSAFTFMFSFMLNRLFSVYKIPILSLPFSIVTMFVYLAALKYSALLSTMVNTHTLPDIALPLILSAFFKSFGTIFFLPYNIAGIAMLLIVLYYSRIIVIMALVGFYFGTMVHSFFLGSLTQALHDPYAFNYILVAIALCGIFLLPTIKNFILALIGVAISVVLTDAITILFNYYAIPVFTIPFNLTVIVFIFTLSLIYYKEFNIDIKYTPEESLSSYLSKIFRFGKIGIKIGLPFSGEWNVYQAFDGEWTHKGEFKYAYDFVKKKKSQTYLNKGLELSDYYAFGESVLAPVSGYVVAIRSDLVDNIIGEVDHVNNWGNYIIIRSDAGYFVEISHLMQFSLSVDVGAYVQQGTILAKCGNSGYSPEPHIHIQVQGLGVLGAFTKEFIFSEYLQDDTLLFNTLPALGESLSAPIRDKSMASRFIFILDDILEYEVYENDTKVGTSIFKVKMNSYGEFYFEDEKNNKLFFYYDALEFYFYNYVGGPSHLKHLFAIVPRLPFISQQKLIYNDFLPLYLVTSKIKQIFIELASSFNKELYKREYSYKLAENRLISTHGEVHFHNAHKAYTKIVYNATTLYLKGKKQ